MKELVDQTYVQPVRFIYGGDWISLRRGYIPIHLTSSASDPGTPDYNDTLSAQRCDNVSAHLTGAAPGLLNDAILIDSTHVGNTKNHDTPPLPRSKVQAARPSPLAAPLQDETAGTR